jgi:hypothetical protein
MERRSRATDGKVISKTKKEAAETRSSRRNSSQAVLRVLREPIRDRPGEKMQRTGTFSSASPLLCVT